MTLKVAATLAAPQTFAEAVAVIEAKDAIIIERNATIAELLKIQPKLVPVECNVLRDRVGKIIESAVGKDTLKNRWRNKGYEMGRRGTDEEVLGVFGEWQNVKSGIWILANEMLDMPMTDIIDVVK